MPRGVFNWSFSDISNFLKDHHFSLNHVEGGHYFYIGHYGGLFRQVCVPFHGSRAINPRTLKGIIRQSGIPKDMWFSQN